MVVSAGLQGRIGDDDDGIEGFEGGVTLELTITLTTMDEIMTCGSGHLTIVANMFIIRDVNLADSDNFLGSPNMFSIAQSKGWWTPGSKFDFTAIFSDGRTRTLRPPMLHLCPDVYFPVCRDCSGRRICTQVLYRTADLACLRYPCAF